MRQFKEPWNWPRRRQARAALAAALALALVAVACASPSAPPAERGYAPVAYAVETPAPHPEPTPPPPPVVYVLETPIITPEPTPPPPTPTPVVEEHAVQAMPVPPSQSLEGPSVASATEEACPDRELGPLPTPGAPGSQGFWLSFREPMPPAPVWNPPGPKRVGLQAGHWRNNEVPRELGRLIGSGTSGGGRAEWEVNLDLAQRAAAILEGYGVQVDILPATVPPSYRAHAFLSIHADGDLSGALRGYKLARAGFSPIPEADDALVEALYGEYGAATGLPRDDLHVSLRMRYYYAFNSRRYCYAIAPGVPAAIIEVGFLTSAVDRQLLLGNPDAAAQGIARGMLSFLGLLEPRGP